MYIALVIILSLFLIPFFLILIVVIKGFGIRWKFPKSDSFQKDGWMKKWENRRTIKENETIIRTSAIGTGGEEIPPNSLLSESNLNKLNKPVKQNKEPQDGGINSIELTKIHPRIMNEKPDLHKGQEGAGYYIGPFLYQTAKAQDCIVGGFIGKWPYVIVADGVSSEANSAAFAESTARSIEKFLQENLPFAVKTSDVIGILEYSFLNARMDLNGISGATTLLIALLWKNKVKKRNDEYERFWWFYAYEGNGLINVISPKRKVDGIAIPSRLITPQAAGHTACLSGNGLTVPPFIGCALCEGGDLLYVASDGIQLANKWILKNENATMDAFLLNNWDKPERINQAFSKCPFDDDAAMGILCIPME